MIILNLWTSEFIDSHLLIMFMEIDINYTENIMLYIQNIIYVFSKLIIIWVQ